MLKFRVSSQPTLFTYTAATIGHLARNCLPIKLRSTKSANFLSKISIRQELSTYMRRKNASETQTKNLQISWCRQTFVRALFSCRGQIDCVHVIINNSALASQIWKRLIIRCGSEIFQAGSFIVKSTKRLEIGFIKHCFETQLSFLLHLLHKRVRQRENHKSTFC